MVPAGDVDYERGGTGYAGQRRTDPRIAVLVHEALGSTGGADHPGGDGRVVNVGAGAGSYEPLDRPVAAVEPSAAMRAQRPAHLSRAVAAVAEHLPFPDGAFAAGMAMVTVHQWADAERGLRELRRVSTGPVVVLTFDGTALDRLWLAQYVPELIRAESARYPDVDRILEVLGGSGSVAEVPVPVDCVDGFTEAYYARPERFLDPVVRRSQSAWGFVDPAVARRGLDRLRRELDDGTWDRRFGHLRSTPQFVGALQLIRAVPA